MSGISKKMMAAASAGTGGGVVEANAIDFDGTNDYLSRSTDLVGNADGKTFTFSAWVYCDNVSIQPIVYASHNSGVLRNYLQINVSGIPQFICANSSGTNVLVASLASARIPLKTWTHYLISVDLTNTSNRAIYLNDEPVSVTWNTYTNTDIDFTTTDHEIAAYNNGFELDGRLAHVFLDYTYRDLSVEANRRLFIDEDGKPASGQAALNPILYLPMDDPDDPGRNDGTGGDFTLNGIVAQSGRGPNQYNAAASTFDGSADNLNRSSALVGASDGSAFTMSFWYKPVDLSGVGSTNSILYFRESNRDRFYAYVNSVGTIGFEGYDISNTTLLNINLLTSAETGLAENKWSHISISVDLSNVAKRFIFVDGVNVTGDANFSTYTSGSIRFGATQNIKVSQMTSANYIDGELSDLWFDTTYIDLSADNPFYDIETGKPKYLGQNGELPTGSSPLIYLPLRADDAGSNKGTGGDFSVNSGPFVGARGPSEFWASSAEFNGSNQNLEKNSALVGATGGSTFSFAVALKANGASDRFLDIGTSGNALRLLIGTSGGGVIQIIGVNSAGATILSGLGSTAFGSAWKTVSGGVDLSDPTKRGIYVDGVAESMTWSTYTSDNIDFSESRVHIGSSTSGTGNLWDGKIGFFWFNTEYIDFSQEANRLKFFDAFGYPVDLGADGSLPTGNQPLIYMNEGFHLGTNLGSGGDFTPVNGPTDGGSVKG